MQKTVSWKDANFAEEPGAVQVKDRTLLIQQEHIALWQDDPEGRFSVRDPSQEGAPVQLEKFYPSL